MKPQQVLVKVLLLGLFFFLPGPVSGGELGKGLVMYLQVGAVDPQSSGTRARIVGARDAAAAFGLTLKQQASDWNPEVMVEQFRTAIDAGADCVGIMGHPGQDALKPLVDNARRKGILVTSGNSPLTDFLLRYQAEGFGYAGVDLYAGGWLTGRQMVVRGELKAGDQALVLGQFGRAERGLSSKGVAGSAGRCRA